MIDLNFLIATLLLRSRNGGESGGVVAQVKTITPSAEPQNVLPDEGYTHLAEVVVEAIPYTITENAAGGLTISIG